MAKTIKEVIKLYSKKNVELSFKVDGEFVYIEGSSSSLKFLSEVLSAYSSQKFLDDYWMSPNGPGNRYFKKDSALGIYFWNTDYDESKIENKKGSNVLAKKRGPAK